MERSKSTERECKDCRYSSFSHPNGISCSHISCLDNSEFEPIFKREIKQMEGKKYICLKDCYTLIKGVSYYGGLLEHYNIPNLIKDGYIKEVKEDNINSILNFHQCAAHHYQDMLYEINQYIVKREIAVLKEAKELFLKHNGSGYDSGHINFIDNINDKISELEKEIK